MVPARYDITPVRIVFAALINTDPCIHCRLVSRMCTDGHIQPPVCTRVIDTIHSMSYPSGLDGLSIIRHNDTPPLIILSIPSTPNINGRTIISANTTNVLGQTSRVYKEYFRCQTCKHDNNICTHLLKGVHPGKKPDGMPDDVFAELKKLPPSEYYTLEHALEDLAETQCIESTLLNEFAFIAWDVAATQADPDTDAGDASLHPPNCIDADTDDDAVKSRANGGPLISPCTKVRSMP